ncbi:mannose-6-phosphate isomerase, class I [Nesterenkonia flava]
MRDYAWGSTTAFSELFDWAPSPSPRAEIWMGAHPTAPSKVLLSDDDAAVDLETLLDGELPFLLKILAAERPLSIQAHPTKEHAEAGFAAENAAGLAADAPERNYVDANHKPELIVAITEFSALCGFRPHAQAHADLTALRGPLVPHPRALDFLDQLLQHIREEDYAAALDWTLTTAAEDAATAARLLAEHLAGEADQEPETVTTTGIAVVSGTLPDTLARITEFFPGDPGLFVALMLNRVDLAPGEALFLPAGNLHAYLAGVGVEIMANSNNVLRGGLTPKRIDVAELLSVAETHVLPLPRCEPQEIAPGHYLYRPPVEEFQLHRRDLGTQGGTHPFTAQTPSIAVVVSGAMTASTDSVGEMRLAAGDSVFLRPGEDVTFSAEGPAQLFIAAAADAARPAVQQKEAPTR